MACGKSALSLKILLALFESANMATQLAIFHTVFSISNKKEEYTSLAFYFILFNPIALVGGFSNIGAFNDTMLHLLILAPLIGGKLLTDRYVLAAGATLVAYFNPQLIFCLLPITVLQARLQVPSIKKQVHSKEPPAGKEEKTAPKHDTFARLLILAVMIDIMLLLICSRNQLSNIKNIMYVNNKSETINSFWYIMVEMFEDRLIFLKKLYLLM
jgi:hypothetical protein